MAAAMIEKLKDVLSGEVSDTDMVDFVSALAHIVERRKGAIKRIDTSTSNGMRAYLLARIEEIRDINAISHSASAVYAILVLMGQVARIAYLDVDDPCERMRKYAEKYLSSFAKPDVVAEFYGKVMCLPCQVGGGGVLGITHGMATGRGLEFNSGDNNVICITVEQLIGAVRNSIAASLPEGDDELNVDNAMTIQSINKTALKDVVYGLVASDAISAVTSLRGGSK